MERKRLISIILTLSMIISIIPFMPSTAMADGTANLNAEGTVKATLTTNSDGTDTIKISGEGKIERDKWIDMVVSFNKGERSYDEDKKMDYPNWGFIETKKTTLKGENNKIKLPDNSFRLFNRFNGNIELPKDLDVSNVTDMSYMFSYATTVDRNLGNWDTSSATDMSYMFEFAKALKLDVSNWNTSNVRSMRGMFYGIKANPDVSNWNTSSVTDMFCMFNQAEVADPDVSNWDTSSVTDMSGMFRFTDEANPDVSNWDVSNVNNMEELFSVTKKANPDVSNWDVASVVTMHSMFYKAEGLKGLDISNWNTSSLHGKIYTEVYRADLGLKTLELDYFIMKRKPGADYPDANKAKENIEGFKAPKFSGDYIVKTFNDKGEEVKTESKKQNEEYNFDDNTHYEVRVNGINKLSFDENYDGGKVINKYFRPPFILSELPKAKERDGYKFVEWNTKTDGTGEKVEAGGTYTEDMVFYAKWEKPVTPPTPDPDPTPTPGAEKKIDKLYIKGYKDGSFKPGGD
ncbi:MAG: BspA family leucine-rich repeat surface protein, partial [Andreesenia angusta]|nr:BspA family leucine-rich repeat surface protein [Andreesenia angusta]